MKGIIIAFFTLIYITGYAQSLTTAQTAAQPVNQNSPVQVNSDKEADGNALAALIIFNKNQILFSDVAVKKIVNPKLKEFSNALRADHTKMINGVVSVLRKLQYTPTKTDILAKLLQQGNSELAFLQKQTSETMDKVYIDTVIKDHVEILKLIDNTLLKNVTNPEVKTQLEMAREPLEQHLEQAQILRNSL